MEFFNLNENSVLVSWKDEVNSSLTRLISSYKTEILSLCKDDIKDCIQSIKSILIIIDLNRTSIDEIVNKIELSKSGKYLSAMIWNLQLILIFYLI